MKRTFIYAFAVAAITFSACSGNSGKDKNDSDSTNVENSASADASAKKGKYAMKSGIISYDTETMGMKMPATLYFDDYGNKECTEINAELEMMGKKVKTHNLTINKDGYTYSIDLENKTGSKMKLPAGAANAQNIDFSGMTPEMMKQLHITKSGTETVCGKPCDIYIMDNSAAQSKATFAVWNNIPLKSTATMGETGISLLANKVQENVTVPSEKFDVPKDIKFTEY